MFASGFVCFGFLGVWVLGFFLVNKIRHAFSF